MTTNDTDDTTDASDAADPRPESLAECVRLLEAENERLRDARREETERLRERVAVAEALLDELVPRASDRPPAARHTGEGRIQSDGGSSACKFVGETSDETRTGVLGCNTAATGTTYGVRGEVDSPGGYGLATTTRLGIEGALDGDLVPSTAGDPISSFLGPTLTVNDGTLDAVPASLPQLDSIGSIPKYKTLHGLGSRFGATAWTEPTYTAGDSLGGQSNDFIGAVATRTGEVVFVPYEQDSVGLYDPQTDSATKGPDHNQGLFAYSGGTLTASGDVVFAPFDADAVGIYDPASGTFSTGSNVGFDNAFHGAVLAPSGDVVFVPSNSDKVGLYDPVNDTYSDGDTHGEGDQAFSGGTLTQTGEVVFAPDNSDSVGVYDPANNTYTSGASHGEGLTKSFSDATVTPTGEVVFAPDDSENVGVYDPVTDTYTSGPTHGEVDSTTSDAFLGAALAPTGEVIFAPGESADVGIYDPEAGTYTSGPSIGVANSPAFSGAATTPAGRVVFPSQRAGFVGVVTTYTDPATHPIVNSS